MLPFVLDDLVLADEFLPPAVAICIAASVITTTSKKRVAVMAQTSSEVAPYLRAEHITCYPRGRCASRLLLMAQSVICGTATTNDQFFSYDGT
jgi:hypothetical protein